MKKLILVKVFFISFLSMCLFHWDIPNASAEKIQESTKTKFVDLRKVKYFEAGVTVGTPALLNLLAGYWMGKIGFRVSGMYWSNYLGSEEKLTGIQLEINCKLRDERKILHSLGIAFSGWSSGNTGENYYGIGPIYSLNRRGFFFGIGFLAISGKNTLKNISPIWGIILAGYVHRFI